MASIGDQLDQLRPKTREDVVAYFQREYPEKVMKNGKPVDQWKLELVSALQLVTTDKSGNQLKRNSLLRRFQKRGEKDWQATKVSKKQQEEYKELGKLLPPMIKEFHMHGKLYILYSKTCESRDNIDIDITGEAGEMFANSGDAQILANIYNELDYDDPDGYPICKDPEVTITPL